jgi:hypothetical protein
MKDDLPYIDKNPKLFNIILDYIRNDLKLPILESH